MPMRSSVTPSRGTCRTPPELSPEPSVGVSAAGTAGDADDLEVVAAGLVVVVVVSARERGSSVGELRMSEEVGRSDEIESQKDDVVDFVGADGGVLALDEVVRNGVRDAVVELVAGASSAS